MKKNKVSIIVALFNGLIMALVIFFTISKLDKTSTGLLCAIPMGLIVTLVAIAIQKGWIGWA